MMSIEDEDPSGDMVNILVIKVDTKLKPILNHLVIILAGCFTAISRVEILTVDGAVKHCRRL